MVEQNTKNLDSRISPLIINILNQDWEFKQVMKSFISFVIFIKSISLIYY
jgi:hypothetical protein